MTLELQNISKSFDGLPVLRNLSLSFHQGQCYCLMSPSGSGKTTLLRILMGRSRTRAWCLQTENLRT